MYTTQFDGGSIILCGGGKMANYVGQSYTSTRRCQTFTLETYTWTESNVSLLEERSIAQSEMLENGTFLVIGGQNSALDSSETTEFLEAIDSGFSYGVEIPERMAKHCSKKVNETHIFATGGLQSLNRTIERGDLTVCTNSKIRERDAFLS